MSDRHGVHPQELPIGSAAQQSPGGGTAALGRCVQMGVLEQPLFVRETQCQVSQIYGYVYNILNVEINNYIIRIFTM